MLNITVSAALVDVYFLPCQVIILPDILRRAFQNIHTQLASEHGPHKGGKTRLLIRITENTYSWKGKHREEKVNTSTSLWQADCKGVWVFVWDSWAVCEIWLQAGTASLGGGRASAASAVSPAQSGCLPTDISFFSLFLGLSLHRCSVKYCC